jgi:cytochrome P450
VIATVDLIEALAAPEALRDPSSVYSGLHRDRPMFWHEGLQSWMVSRHDACRAVLRDSARFASDWRRIGGDLPPAAINIQSLDPPAHTPVRHLLLDAVRYVDDDAVVRELERQATGVLGALAQRSSFDVVTEFAEPVALSTTARLLGVPEPDLATFRPVADAITDGMDAGVWPQLAGPATAAKGELAALADGWLADTPPTGIVGHLARRADTCGIERSVLANTVRVALHAGFTSAAKLLSLGAWTLLSRPEGLSRFTAADPTAATDELVRFTSPVRAVARVCLVDTPLAGTTVRAGEVVTLLLGAANRDPVRFPDPDALQLDRTPNPHLGFGFGAHACLGSWLATLQAQVCFGILAAQHPEAHTTGRPAFRRNLTLRGLRHLPAALHRLPAPAESTAPTT